MENSSDSEEESELIFDDDLLDGEIEKLLQENFELKREKERLTLMCEEIDEEETLNETTSNERNVPHRSQAKFNESLMKELLSLEEAFIKKQEQQTLDSELKHLRNVQAFHTATSEQLEKDEVELNRAITEAEGKKEDLEQHVEIVKDSLEQVTNEEIIVNELTLIDRELEEVNEALKTAKETLAAENGVIKELTNEIAIKSAELASQPIDNKRGNCLFGEIDSMAQSADERCNNLEKKYVDLSNKIAVKTKELEHLQESKKASLLKLRQEKEAHVSPYNALIKKQIETHKNKVEELEAEVCGLSRRLDSPQLDTSGPHAYNMRYIHKLVDDARADASKAIEELNTLSSQRLSAAFRKEEAVSKRAKQTVELYLIQEEIEITEKQLAILKESQKDSQNVEEESSSSGSSKDPTEEKPPGKKRIVHFAECVKNNDGGPVLRKEPLRKQKEYKIIKVITKKKKTEESQRDSQNVEEESSSSGSSKSRTEEKPPEK